MDTLELPVVDARRPTFVGPADVDRRRPVPGPRRRWRPFDRPPVVSRLFAALLAMGAMLSTVALLLSDRAPDALSAVFGDRARRLWARIDASERVDVPAAEDLPPTDFLVHVAIWAVVATLVGLAIWSWRGLIAAAVVLAGTSGMLELAQGRYADTRAVELHDAIANLLGISLGVAAVGCCYVVWSLAAASLRRFRRS